MTSRQTTKRDGWREVGKTYRFSINIYRGQSVAHAGQQTKEEKEEEQEEKQKRKGKEEEG